MARKTNAQLTDEINELEAKIGSLMANADEVLTAENEKLRAENAKLNADVDNLLESSSASNASQSGGLTVVESRTGTPIAIVQLLGDTSMLTLGNLIHLGEAAVQPEPDRDDSEED